MRIVKAQDERGVDCSTPQLAQDAIPISPSTRAKKARDASAFIGKGVHFKGTITHEGTIRIDGSFEGDIHTDGIILVSEGAEMKATVTAGTIVCKGKITGDICAKEKFIMQAPSVVIGDVRTPKLLIEEGAILDGTLEMSQNSRDAKREPALRDMRHSNHMRSLDHMRSSDDMCSSDQFVVRRMTI